MVFFRTCCFCGTLTVGAVISGIFTLLDGIGYLASAAYDLEELKTLYNFLEEHDSLRIYYNIDPNVKEFYDFQETRAYFWIVRGVLTVLTSLLLLLGVKMKRQKLAYPWLIFWAFASVGIIIHVVYASLAYFFHLSFWVYIGETIIMIFLYFVALSWFLSSNTDPEPDGKKTGGFMASAKRIQPEQS